ncbi:MAG TPA: hypothetical protein VFT66_26385 [Roseiflexaceae bacterium]|jgi:hypothetical protein|nr:hypothetical protein [Roseiflexaceae bacterium]
MSTQTLKVTMNQLFVRDNGDAPGKSELYWSLMADDQLIDIRDVSNALKVGDGETIVLGNSGTVTKSTGATLTILGSVADKDDFLKGADDTASFKHTFTAANGWGIGSHTAQLNDGKHLNITLQYTIAAE